jgi:indolepyruvate ferredoxin oxidoreductase beta subunit
MNAQRPISILVCALGGEGGGVLAQWLVDVARLKAHPAQATSIPGVAQRTGATTYYIEIFPQPIAALNGQRPVLGLNPLPGRLDALISSELLETNRQIGNGWCSADHTLIISSTARTLTTMEKMAMGDGRQNEQPLRQMVAQHSQRHHLLDMAALTREAGTVVSAVMLGCLAASGLLPFERADFEQVIGQQGAAAKASLKGFALGHDAITAQRQHTQYLESVLTPLHSQSNGNAQTRSLVQIAQTTEVPPWVAATFPTEVQPLIALGHQRMVSYQNQAYAQLYVKRLQAVHQAEQAAGGQTAITAETARWLALWMAYDDVIRVADLKSRGSRWQRVRTEVRAGEHDLLRVYDHFKPGIPELAGLLPQGLADRLLRWDRARVAAGHPPWSMPLKIASHSVTGMLALRFMARLKGLRVLGSRHQQEQALMGQWLSAITDACAQSPELGLEVARCGRLIKGYGSTNERAKRNLLHILSHVPGQDLAPAEKARLLAGIREAALKDEAGKALDQALVQAGVPARPVPEQPIRWMRNPRQSR